MKILTVSLVAFTLFAFAGGAPQEGSPRENRHADTPPAMGLHMAALTGNLHAIEQHIAAGSNLNEKDAYGSTPLIIAVTFGKTEVAQALIDAGADLEIVNKDGSTALHIASFFGRIGIVKSLLNHGANRYARNSSGATARDIVAAPFENDQRIFDTLTRSLGPLGLKLDYEQIRGVRPALEGLLRSRPADLAAVTYTPSAADDWTVSTPTAQGLDPLLVAELYRNAAEMERLFGLLVIKNGQLIAEGYFNEGSVEQTALLQSVTKSYTSALVGLALQQGHLSSPDQKMIEFFPELSARIKDPRKRQITIREMLQMRAGYPWEETSEELFKILYAGFRPSLLVDFALTGDPGTVFNYSNLTSHLLAIMVARACGRDLKSFAQTHLFTPLEVTVGDPWTRDLEGYFLGHGGIRFTARDAAKFGLLYLNGGEFAGKRIIPADWVRDSLQSYSKNVSSGAPRAGRIGRYFHHIGYGYQWWSATVGRHQVNYAAGHGGQLIVLLKDQDMVVVVTSDPFFGQHGAKAWQAEQANFNLVGQFIKALPGAD